MNYVKEGERLEDLIEKKSEELRELFRCKLSEKAREEKAEGLKKEITELREKLERASILAMAEEFAGRVKGYVSLGKEVADANKAEVASIIKLILGLFADVREEIEPELARMSLINAQAMRRDYKNLTKSGFKPTEAFQIILAKIKPVTALDTVSSAVSTAGKVPPAAAAAKSIRR